MIEVDVVDACGLAEIRAFYETVGYGGGVSAADVTLAARFNGRLLGAVRLCTERGVLVLRGMQVDPDAQRKGVGRALLGHCLPYLDTGMAYCLPYDHLVKFYGQIGFEVTSPESLPAFLADRLTGYVSSNLPTIAMRRIP